MDWQFSHSLSSCGGDAGPAAGLSDILEATGVAPALNETQNGAAKPRDAHRLE
jgi:hypothetical protein